MSESSLMRSIQLCLSSLGVRVLRNNVGMLEDKQGTKVRYGLCVGSSDLIGWYPVTITPEMVGKKIAIFTAVEVKTPTGRLTKEQVNFLDAIKSAGGIAFVSRSVEEAERFIKNL